MKQTLSILFTVEESNLTKKTGLTPIICSLTVNGQRTRFRIPMKVTMSEFRTMMAQRTNNYIKDFTADITNQLYEAQNDLIRQGVTPTAINIRDYWRDGRLNSCSLSRLWADFLKSLKLRVGVNLTQNVYDNYDRTAKRMIDFIGGDKEVTAITAADVKDLYTHWQGQFMTATSGMMLQKVRTLFSYAIDKGLIMTNPTSSIKISRQNREIELMTEAEYQRLKSVELPPYLDRIRDCFVFAANSGLAYTDANSLTKEDIQYSGGQCFINKKRNKTGVEFFSVVLPDGVEVLRKYHGSLPKYQNQVLNRMIKQIASIAAIETNLTCHLMRHYYITKLIAMNVPLSVVQRCAGHSNVAMTSRYTHLCNEYILTAVEQKIK